MTNTNILCIWQAQSSLKYFLGNIMKEQKESTKFKNANNVETIKFCLNSNFKAKNAYHHTTLETLHKIFSFNTLRFSRLTIMNDIKELNFAEECRDYFFCLTEEKDVTENFGMWAMYGKITEYSQENPTGNNIGVKIRFTKEVIENLRNELSLKFHSVGYANLMKNDSSKISCGTITTAKDIKLDSNILAGYIKDNAWKYESEFRFRQTSSKVTEKDDFIYLKISDEILSSLVVYPCPLSSKEECERIFKSLDKKDETAVVFPHFEENKYKDTYRLQKSKN